VLPSSGKQATAGAKKMVELYKAFLPIWISICRMFRSAGCAVLWLSLILLANNASAGVYYVASNGDDANPGTIDQPFATIAKARDTIRALGTDGHTVYIRGGTYRITSPLVFTEVDSGSEGAPNVYRNYPGETPVISGGQVLTAEWTVYSGGIWKCNVGEIEFNSLFVDGVRATRAREPDVGWYTSLSGPDTTQSFGYTEGDIDPDWTNLTRIEIQYTRANSSPRFRISSVDAENNYVYSQGTFVSSQNKLYGGNRYYVENVFEGLDNEGEWYLDAVTDTLYYYPVGGKNPNTSEIVYPVVGGVPTDYLACLLNIKGSSAASQAAYITISGITFAHSDWCMSPTLGFEGWTNWIERSYRGTSTGISPAVILTFANNCRVSHCTIHGVGGNAIAAYGVTDITFSHLTIYDVGVHGVACGSTAYTYASYLNSGLTLSDCLVHDVGVVLPIGSGVFVCRTTDCRIVHNKVYNCARYGIALSGWNQHTYSDRPGNHSVLYNEVYNTTTGTTDAGALYFAYDVRGSEACYNKIHDCGASDVEESGNGVYFDDTLGGTVHKNWIYRTAYPLFYHIVNDAHATNNVIASTTNWFMIVSAFTSTFRQNIWFNTEQVDRIYRYQNNVNQGNYDWNLYYDVAPDPSWSTYMALLRDANLYTGICNVTKNDDGTSTVARITGASWPTAWVAGTDITIGGIDYDLISVLDAITLVVADGPDTAMGVAYKCDLKLESHSIEQDPQFVDFAHDDFTLQAGSPALAAQGEGGIGFENFSLRTVGPRIASYRILALTAMGGDVSPSGETTVIEGGTQTFTFTPEAGYSVADVLVDGVSVGAVSSYTFNNVSDDHSISVSFAAGVYTLAVSASNGSVTKSPDTASYAYNQSVSLTATPAAGYHFVNWSGDLSGSSNPATLVMDGNKSVTAIFASNVHTLTITANGGTVTRNPDKASYEYGESVTLTASASAGYSFTGWSGAASGTNSSVTIVMDGDKSVTANFAAISYTLSIAATNGSVVANPQKAGYSYGESVSLQAVPNTGYHFTGWSGSLSGSTNPASIVMNADKSVTAGFAINTYTLTTNATNGSVVKSPQAATYTHGATVSLQAVAAEGYEFAGWSGAVTGSANPVEIVMDSSKSVTAAFTVKTYTLTTSATNGSVVRSPESTTYTHGSTVSLQAVAAEGYHFTGWSGAVTGSSNPVNLVMDASKSVTAAFAANTYTLSISASNGTVTANPSQATYTHGQVVTLTATPSTGYSFSSWSGDASGTAASTTITMDANKSVTAAFTLNTYTLSISAANGTVTRDPEQATYTHGQTVTLTAVPATGYSFSSWSGDLSGTVASATITMDGNKSVAAGFTINSYTLNTSGANGSITKNPDKSTYTHGETVTLQAVPAEGYNFVNWSGDLAGSANPATLVMDSNKTVAAAFAANTYTLQTNATNGSVTRTPDQASFTFGQTVTLTAVPATGYSFSSWSGDASGSTATVTLTMNADKSVTAGFTANAYTLSVSASNGSVTVSPIRETYTHGEVVTLTAVPSVGYSFGSWSGDASGTATSTMVTMDSNKSVTAVFSLNTYTLSVTSANGTVTKNPSQATYNHGDTVALTAAPAEGYRFAGWSGDLTGSSNPATLTMTSNKSVMAHFTAVSNDNEPPVLFGFSPLAEAIQVPLNSLVLLRVTDSGDGVDANTVTIRINDNIVYAGNVASVSGAHGVCRRVGTPAHYVYAFQPAEDFDYDSTVTVTVNAADLAGNAMAQQSYSFRTQMRTFGSNHCASWGPDGLDKGGAATACDASGNVWVVWHAGPVGSRDIYLSRLTSGQEQFGGPIQLTSNPSDQCNPDIAIGPNGRLFVVWQDNRRGNWDIYLRTSADGVTWSSEIEATDFTNDETNPVIAVDARSPSYAYIAWQDNRAGNQDIYVASSSTNFASKTVARVTSNVQDQIGPRIAVDGANGVYLVWTDFRNGAADVYGAASNSGPWTNVAVAAGAGSQSAPDIAAEPGGYSLHFVWVNRVDNQDDVFYGTSIGLPASPLAGINIIDDTSSADQRTPAIVASGSGGTARVFAVWKDFRNAADGLDTDLYVAEIKAGSVTNLFVGDGWTRTNQTEPCIGVDLFGRPYVVWTDDRNARDEIYFAASTFVEPTPLDVRMVVGATGGTVGVALPTQLDDVSVVIPAGACPYDVTVSIARIWNLEPGLPADILPYEFGPSGLQFEAPVTITIPYAIADFPGAPPQPYWYDTMTGAMSQQGITNIQYLALSSTLHALRFQTTHFTPYAVVGEVEEGIVPRGGGGGGGGGCSLSPTATGACGVLEYFVPFTVLALAMIGLRIKDKRRHSKPQ